jgi:hypothetical protein
MDLYELLPQFVSQTEKPPFDYLQLRGPLLACGFGMVIVYQLFLKKSAVFNKKQPEEDPELGDIGN